MKLGGVDKRIGAGVEKRRDERQVIQAGVECQTWMQHDEHKVDVLRQPGDRVERADEDHGLDDVGLDPVRLGIGGDCRRRPRVAGHYSRIGPEGTAGLRARWRQLSRLAWSTLKKRKAGHYARLTTNGRQNAPVAEDKDGNYDEVVGHAVPHVVGHSDHVAAKQRVTVAGAVLHCA